MIHLYYNYICGFKYQNGFSAVLVLCFFYVDGWMSKEMLYIIRGRDDMYHRVYQTGRAERLEFEWICPYCGIRSSEYHVVEEKMYYTDRGALFGDFGKKVLEEKEQVAYNVAEKAFQIHYKAFLRKFNKNTRKLGLYAECDKCQKTPAWARSRLRSRIYMILVIILPVLSLITGALVNEWKTTVNLGFRWVPLALIWLAVLTVLTIMIVTAIKRKKELKRYRPENFPRLCSDEKPGMVKM